MIDAGAAWGLMDPVEDPPSWIAHSMAAIGSCLRAFVPQGFEKSAEQKRADQAERTAEEKCHRQADFGQHSEREVGADGDAIRQHRVDAECGRTMGCLNLPVLKGNLERLKKAV